jgi:serine/threonine-protein kinase
VSPQGHSAPLGYRPGVTDPRDPAATPPPEHLLGGRYRLGPLIGRGGMATIHRATDVRLERDVAVKLLRPEVAADPDLAQRFRREALAATVLRHPNIVACLDTGTDGDQAYLVMDLVEGEDLSARLKRGGRLAPWQVARIGLDVARGLGVAHIRGIVHRDVKPGNILLATDGRAMVTDFGIARLAMDAEAALPGTTLGSVHYFSPEQARGTTTTPASDVYGLGLVLFEALTGTRAWTGDTTDAIALARLGKAAPSVRALRPEVPVALETVVQRALALEPGDRYPNGATMAAALEPIVLAADPASPTSVVATPIVPEADAAPPAAPPLEPAGVAARRDPRARRPLRPAGSARSAGPRRSPSVLAALGALGVLAALILVAARPGAGDGQGRPEPSVPALAETTREPVATVTPTPDPTPTATPTPDPTAEPTAAPTPLPAGEVADLCEIFFELPCGLGAGRYAPSRFEPAFDVEIGDGWSNAVHREDIVSLTRTEGLLTFAGEVKRVFDREESREPRPRARDLMEAFVATDGVSATRPVSVRIGDRRGLSADLTPTGSERIELFATESSSFFLEPDRTTRLVVIDLPRQTTALLAIEPNGGFELAEILETADPAAATIRWR